MESRRNFCFLFSFYLVQTKGLYAIDGKNVDPRIKTSKRVFVKYMKTLNTLNKNVVYQKGITNLGTHMGVNAKGYVIYITKTVMERP